MQQGDILTKVEGEDLAELGYAGALSKIRGEAGTTVQLTIQRNGDTLELDVERQNIEVTTAEGQMLDGQIGYIRISSFKGNTPEQFQAIYDRLVQDGAKALIFDLRDDGGGLVSALEKILDPLLPEGEIAIATYRDGTTKTLVESDATGNADIREGHHAGDTVHAFRRSTDTDGGNLSDHQGGVLSQGRHQAGRNRGSRRRCSGLQRSESGKRPAAEKGNRNGAGEVIFKTIPLA